MQETDRDFDQKMKRDRQTDRQTDRKTDRQTDGQIERVKMITYLRIMIITDKQRLLDECLLIYNLPGKVSRRLVESQGLPGDLTCIIDLSVYP